MANELDLEEQEQLDQLKHFWKKYGNVISWVLIVVMGAYAGWNAYQYWQRKQSTQAAAMADEVERVASGGDIAKIERAFGDMKDRFGGTAYAQQTGLMVAKVFFEAGKADAAKSALEWVASKASDDAYRAVARIRLAGLLAEAKSYPEALAQLGASMPSEFEPLAADRKGDILALQGKSAEARAEYQKAFKGFDAGSGYRRLVEIKLDALGGNPPAADVGGPPLAVASSAAQGAASAVGSAK